MPPIKVARFRAIPRQTIRGYVVVDIKFLGAQRLGIMEPSLPDCFRYSKSNLDEITEIRVAVL